MRISFQSPRRRDWLALASAALLGVAAAKAIGQPVDAAVSNSVVGEDMLPPAVAHFPGGVTALRDVVYATRPGYRPLLMDVYTPHRRPSRGRLPLVVFVHGGAWMGGHSRGAGAFSNFPAVLASLASRGYVVASVNYRLSGEARFPAAVEDVRDAISYLRPQSDRFGLDSGRVLLWGVSAGGQIAALVATACEIDFSSGQSRQPPTSRSASETRSLECIQGAAIWYGAFDLRNLEESPSRQEPTPTSAYLGCQPSRCRDLATLASPIAHVDAADPPMLLIHGEEDRIIPVSQTRAMEMELRRARVRSAAIEIPGAGHSWIGATPRATRHSSILALQRTFEFFDEISRRLVSR